SVALALQILSGVNSTLRANRVRPLHRHDGKQINIAAFFDDLNDSGQSSQPTAYYNDSWIICHSSDFPLLGRARTGFYRFGTCRVSRLLRRRAQFSQAAQSDTAQHEEKCQAHSKEALARFFSGDDAPLRTEQPNPVGEVPGGSNQSYQIEEEESSLQDLALNLAKGSAGVFMQINPGEAHGVCVPDDIE